MNKFMIAGVTLCCFLLGGCINQKQKDCWSEATKEHAASVMREQALHYIGALVKAGDINALTDEKKKSLDQSLSLVLSNFIVKNSIPDVNSLTCSASVKFTFTKPNGTSLNDERMVDFELFDGEKGRVIVVDTGPLIKMINQSEEK